MLADSSAFFIPSLESRRQAAAVGLSKLLDGQGRGALSEVQPVFAPPTTSPQDPLTDSQHNGRRGCSTLIN